MKSFYTWLQKKYAGEDSSKGDLAEDIKRTRKTFPTRSNNRWLILGYLHDHKACLDCLIAFDECWIEYELEELGIDFMADNRWVR